MSVLVVWLLAAEMLVGIRADADATVTTSPSWSIVNTSNLGELNGVACATSTSCMAVGEYFSQTASAWQTLAESWDGTGWSIVTTPNPAGASGSYFEGVSCVSSTSCMAVGYSVSGSNWQTLAESWDGTAWSIVTTPNPAGAVESNLRGVSCVSTTSCTAAGWSFQPSSPTQALVESWNGIDWSIATTPSSAGAALEGVSCASSVNCTAAGQLGDQTLVESWNGTTWSIVSTPAPVDGFERILLGVSCVSSISCTAVGYVDNGSADLALVESWNGATWSIVTTPNPTYLQLDGVSCVSSASCIAVGYSGNGTSDQTTVVESWNGATWSALTAPNPAGATDSNLDGVSCVTAAGCTAVGFDNGSSDQTLVEVGPVPTPATVPGAPNTVTATAANAHATVSFRPPADNGGSPVFSYKVAATDLSDAAHGGQTASGPASPITLAGLTNRDRYAFSVRAINSVGSGPPSAPSNAVVPFTVGCNQVLPSGSVVGMAVTSGGNGYWIASSTGLVAACGDAPWYGNGLSRTAAIATAPSGDGYWLVTTSGVVTAFGSAARHGGIPPTVHLSRPIVAMAGDPDTGGYWLLGGDGGVFSFHAPFYGSTGNIVLRRPAVGMAATPNGNGYYFVASDGGIFAFGKATFFGSTGNVTLRKPVVGMAIDPSTSGYWMDASDGGIFAFHAPFYGSTGNITLAEPCVGMTAMHNGLGYRFVAADGGIFDFGRARFEGSAA